MPVSLRASTNILEDAMFADSLLDSARTDHSRRGWTTFVSFAAQALAAAVLLLLPLFYTQALPPFQLMARLVAPTPPPAPPPAGPMRNTRVSSSNVSSDGHVIAPRFVPREIAMLDEPSPPPAIENGGPGVVGSTGTDRNGVLHSIESGIATVVPPPPTSAAHPPRVSRMMEGNLIYRVQPQYPPLARQARIHGMVVLRAMISREGKIENVQVISGPPLLVKSAMDAVLQWRYRPYFLNNEPVEVETQVTVNFTLSGG
jgi:periplasmic protein TonB